MNATRTSGRVVFEVGIPPRAMTPNGRTRNFLAYHAMKKKRMGAAMALVHNQKPIAPWASACVRITYYHRRRGQHLDPDALFVALKGEWDGLQMEGIIENDRRLVMLPPQYVHRPGQANSLKIEVIEGVEIVA